MATVLRPMNVGELLDRTFFLYRKNFLILVSIVAIPQLVLLFLRLPLLAMQTQVDRANPLSYAMKALLLNLAVAVVGLLMLMLSQAATMIAVADLHLGKRATIGNSFTGVKNCLPELILTSILVGLGFVVGFILLIIPAFIILVAWSLAIPIVVIEKESPLDAIPRSARLTKGSRWRIFLILLLIFVFRFIVVMFFQIPVFAYTALSVFRHAPGIPLGVSVYSLVAGFLSTSVVAPISTIALALIYFDARVRKEGFDLQFMMSSLKSAGPEPPENPTIS
jgi:hypothetical protein